MSVTLAALALGFFGLSAPAQADGGGLRECVKFSIKQGYSYDTVTVNSTCKPSDANGKDIHRDGSVNVVVAYSTYGVGNFGNCTSLAPNQSFSEVFSNVSTRVVGLMGC